MCGRFTVTSPEEAARSRFRDVGPPRNLQPRHNVAPTQDVAVVGRKSDGSRRLGMMRWGLVPHWAKDSKLGFNCINARMETVATAPAYREAFRRRRCLILADGFYEWRVTGPKTKQPYRVTLRGGGPFAFAGLWERWTGGDQPLLTCTIVTGPANALLAQVHERMPVMLPPEHHEAWLDGTAGLEVLTAHPAEALRAYPVGPRVGNVRNDDAELLEPVGPDLGPPG